MTSSKCSPYVLSTNTHLRTLPIAVALSKIGEKGTATGQSLVSHKYPHPRATCMLFCTCFDTSYRLQKFRVIIRISNNCKQRERHVAQGPIFPCMITLISTDLPTQIEANPTIGATTRCAEWPTEAARGEHQRELSCLQASVACNGARGRHEPDAGWCPDPTVKPIGVYNNKFTT